MLGEILDYIIAQLLSMGPSGFIIGVLLVVLSKVWKALQNERRRSDNLVDKMQEMSRETATMIERITSR